MKNSIFLLLIFSLSVEAKEICKEYKPELTDRDDEEWHSEESALKALNFLERYVKGEGTVRNTDPWWAPVRIEGSMLRISALDAGADPKNDDYIRYCEFVTRQGVHRPH